MKIGLKTVLTTVSLVVIAAILGLCAALFDSTSKLHDAVVNLVAMSNNIKVVQDLESDLLSHSRESLLWKLTGREIHKTKRDQARIDFFESLERGRVFVETPPEEGLFRQIEASSKEYFDIRDRFESQDIPSVQAAEMISPYTDHLLVLLRSFATLNLDEAKASQLLAAKDDQTAKNTAILATVLAIVALLATLLFTWRHLFSPLRRVIHCIEGLTRRQLPSVIDSRIREVSLISETLRDSALKLMHQRESHLRHIAAVAHDIKNPISAIKSSVELVEESGGLDEDSRELVQIIHRQSDYLSAMVSDFLDTTRAQSGSLNIRKSHGDLGKSVLDAARLFSNYSKIHDIRVETPPRLVSCYFDCTRISQVLNNLISNSIKYSPSGGTIRIELKQEGRQAIISVTDSGIGIAAEEMESIFLPFRRSKKTLDLIPGVGLGLFTSREIVSAHGGELTVKSLPGEGSTFTLKLPLDSPHKKENGQAAAASLPRAIDVNVLERDSAQII